MHRLGRLLSTTVGALALTFPAAAVSPAVAKLPCDFCQDMMGGGGWGHSFQSPGALFRTDDWHVGWQPGICAQDHLVCNPFEEDEEALDLSEAERIVGGDDADEITRLIESHPERVQFVAHRGAVQLRGCNGMIVAHIALSDAVVNRLMNGLLR